MALKILFLSHRFYPDIGGIEVNSEILACAFSDAGHQVRLVTWSEQDGQKKFPFVVKRKPNSITLLKEHAWADIVFENNPCMRLAWPSVLFGKPSVVALRTWINRNDGAIAWQDRLKINWLGRADAVIAVSEAVRKRCWPGAKVIGNPYRSHLFRIKEGVKRDTDFVFLGRLVSDKGVPLVISALHKLLYTASGEFDNKRCSLTVIGDGPDRDKLMSLVQQLGLEKSVRFAGALRGEDLVSCLNQHRFMIVPSLWEEPFGNVALEGMACGCVPIVSDGGGLPDAVGEAGLVFTRGDVDALADCMRKLCSSPHEEQRLRSAGVTQLAKHQPETISRQYLQVIEMAKRSL